MIGKARNHRFAEEKPAAVAAVEVAADTETVEAAATAGVAVAAAAETVEAAVAAEVAVPVAVAVAGPDIQHAPEACTEAVNSNLARMRAGLHTLGRSAVAKMEGIARLVGGSILKSLDG